MNTSHSIPVFAIVGHPNEGKSSVLSTLAEDDSVRVSPIPGETVLCQEFPVRVDGQEILRFVDTPGFQNPRKTLQWMQRYQGPDAALMTAFIAAHQDDPDFTDDCELLGPVAEGAGVIFVVDGSKPVRNVDRAEMEILRLSGAPRMAIINSKEDDTDFLAQWQSEFRKHFNAIRVFNSSRATYIQRIELLENLKAIDQQWEPALRAVVEAFKSDWQMRCQQTAELIVHFVGYALSYHKTVPCSENEQKELSDKMWQAFQRDITQKERALHKDIRRLFKHNIFDISLPEHSILEEDLFSKTTWEFLGLTDRQLVMAGAMGGAVVGAGVDVAAAGISFGVFSAIGGLVGAAATALKGKEWLSGVKLLGMRVGGEQLQVGPAANIQLLYVLLDRSLLFYNHVINWSHGRRDYDTAQLQEGNVHCKEGVTTGWGKEQRKICTAFFQAAVSGKGWSQELPYQAMGEMLLAELQTMSEKSR
ncbi:MAG: hypothetical protein CSB34_00085 [Desulfobulbus propionicus]|nr:MAG: hypothetical protein CSB34_00085 [Desulfobulbus propionicus]